MTMRMSVLVGRKPPSPNASVKSSRKCEMLGSTPPADGKSKSRARIQLIRRRTTDRNCREHSQSIDQFPAVPCGAHDTVYLRREEGSARMELSEPTVLTRTGKPRGAD